MHQQSARQLQDRLTSMSVVAVLDAATQFFARGSGVYSAFLEKRSPTHVALRGQGGEELVIAARETDAGTAVSGSSYLFDQRITRFLSSLPPVPAVVPSTDPTLATAEPSTALTDGSVR